MSGHTEYLPVEARLLPPMLYRVRQHRQAVAPAPRLTGFPVSNAASTHKLAWCACGLQVMPEPLAVWSATQQGQQQEQQQQTALQLPGLLAGCRKGIAAQPATSQSQPQEQQQTAVLMTLSAVTH